MRLSFSKGLLGLAVVGAWLAVNPVMADVRVLSVIGSGMVLQRGVKVPVWGWADPGEKVKVSFAGQSVTGKADKAGDWKVYLQPMIASAVPGDMVISAKNTINLNDILVGDVWICGGQSNMAWPTIWAVNAQTEMNNANYPGIRLIVLPKAGALQPQKDTKAAWSRCSTTTVSWFSAVGYFFGRALYKHLNVPIGLIDNSIGGTRAEAWTSEQALAANPYFKFEADNLKKAIATNNNDVNVASACFNNMCAPIIPFAVKGAIWYQGEGNAGVAGQYCNLLNTMVKDWRTRWENKDMPFLIVQLANFLAPPVEPGPSSWGELREAQVQMLKTKNTGLALAIDIGEAADIHPKNKQDVGYRLSLAARKVAYGEDLVYSGPMYRSMSRHGNKIVIKFDHVAKGLVARGGDLKQFAIAGADQKFYWAKAVIEGKNVVVSSDKVEKPVAVRYAWAENPEGCNLYNSENLPASPFRTDKWPGITAGLPKK